MQIDILEIQEFHPQTRCGDCLICATRSNMKMQIYKFIIYKNRLQYQMLHLFEILNLKLTSKNRYNLKVALSLKGYLK